MAATKCSENASETVKNGFVELSVTQVWQVIAASRTTPFTTVLQDVGLPTLGSSAIFDTATLWVVSRVPVRVDSDATERKWNVTVQWSNNTGTYARDTNGDPVTDPTSAAKTVDVTFQEYAKPIDAAVLSSVTIGGIEGTGTALTAPSWISTTDPGPIRVSTGEPVFAEKIEYTEVVTVSRIERSWTSNYDTYKNTINDATVVITESDVDGTRATYTYAAGTLRMKPITKMPIWQDAKMYFRVRFEMEHNAAGWLHSEVDRSQKRRVFVGQYKPDGGTYSQTDVNDAAGSGSTDVDYAYVSILTDDGSVAIGDPVKLNGNGAEMPIDRSSSYDTESEVYLNYEVYEEKDWSALSL